MGSGTFGGLPRCTKDDLMTSWAVAGDAVPGAGGNEGKDQTSVWADRGSPKEQRRWQFKQIRQKSFKSVEA
jgi:hypothetical protein